MEPRIPIASEAMQSILDADYIIIGPGDLYTSILANVVVDGASAALKKTKAKIIYISNLVTKYGQTFGFGASEHLAELEKYIGRAPDITVVNAGDLPERILKKYKEEDAYPVKDNLGDEGVVRADLLVPREIKTPEGDTLKRSLLRHDSDKLAWEIIKLIKEDSLQS